MSYRYLAGSIAIEFVTNGKAPQTIYEKNMIKTLTNYGLMLLDEFEKRKERADDCIQKEV